jgi:hypothetical protein
MNSGANQDAATTTTAVATATASTVVNVKDFVNNTTATVALQVEAVMDRIKDNVSLDHMARLLVDVQQDSSSIVDSIISQHQRELLNLIFLGDAPNRNKVKFTVILSLNKR